MLQLQTMQILQVCHGGCLHDGFLKTSNFKPKTFLCSAYKKIFAHIETRLNKTKKIS